MSNLIEVTGVSKSYGGVQALSVCDLQVREGEINGLIGPNGSGKTTLFNVITGYERIQQGRVHFNAAEITNAPPDRVFKLGIGRTFQLTRLFMRLSVLENMLVATQRKEGWLRGVMRLAGSASEKRRAMELLDFVGISRLAHEPAGNLSYGQRKLLELASLLVSDPAVLLLDEPAGGINPTLITHLADRIKELNKAGKTLLIVEHNMEFVMDAYLGGADDAETQLEIGESAAHHSGPGRVSVTPMRTVPREKLGDSQTLLSVRGITAGYGGGDILKQVSLDVPRGVITCVVGPNGAGKSTLMATISGLLHPREGEITFDGERVSGLTPKQVLTKGLSQIPQAHSLFGEMTVRENVEMGAFTVNDRALVAQRLKAVEELYPIVSERAGDKAGSLSGGQQRLVEFARCLMLDPTLIMLDEPSMGLDPQARQMVFEMIELMNKQGKTILLVEQNARAGLKMSSHGVVLENGMVRLTGSGREVLEHPEIGALYLGGAVASPAST